VEVSHARDAREARRDDEIAVDCIVIAPCALVHLCVTLCVHMRIYLIRNSIVLDNYAHAFADNIRYVGKTRNEINASDLIIIIERN